jgi:hypothetical protein
MTPPLTLQERTKLPLHILPMQSKRLRDSSYVEFHDRHQGLPPVPATTKYVET